MNCLQEPFISDTRICLGFEQRRSRHTVRPGRIAGLFKCVFPPFCCFSLPIMLSEVGWNIVLIVAAVTLLVCVMVNIAIKGQMLHLDDSFVKEVSYLINTQKARINEAFTEAEGEAMTSRRKLEGRQGPKHLEKMLFTNNREEERLQRHLQELNNSSRLRGMELDREKVEVHNEMRLSRRRNSAPSLVVVPADSDSETAAVAESTPVAQSLGPKPFTRGTGPATSKSRQPAETDPANEYLLTEFKRVSEVIPNILNSLNRPEDKCAAGGDNQKRDSGRWKASLLAAGRRGSLAGLGGGAATLTTPRLPPDEALTRAGTRETPGEPKIANIVNMIRKIKSLRGEMAANKRAELMRSKTTFKDLLKNIQEEESKGGDSDTYTDGACSLLRRKMYKARRASCPVLDVASVVGSDSMKGEAILQKRNSAPLPFASLVTRTPPVLGRSSSSMALLGRLGSREAEGYRRALLQQEDRELTEMKVATEWRRYDQIRKRIGHFLHDVDNGPRRASLPILPDSAVQEVELQDT